MLHAGLGEPRLDLGLAAGGQCQLGVVEVAEEGDDLSELGPQIRAAVCARAACLDPAAQQGGLPPLRLTGGVERFSGCLGVGGQEFELYGSESAKATLAAASMVGPFDPGDDGEAEFFSGLPALAVEDVLLEQ